MCCGGTPQEAQELRGRPFEAFLSLGSNLGDRRRTLEDAVEALEQEGVRVISRSSFYETQPTDHADQPWFVNMVLRIETERSPLSLLEACQTVEKRFGRVRGIRYGPRTLDIDVLLYDEEIIDDPRLAVPHPRMRMRRFVLVPLLEIDRTRKDPRDGRLFADILQGLDEGKQVVRSASIES